MKKRLLSVLLTLIILIGMFPQSGFAAAPKYRALLIAEGNYLYDNPLSAYASNNLNAMKQVLGKYDRYTSIDSYLDLAGAGTFLDVIERAFKSATADDVSVFYFSGHGGIYYTGGTDTFLVLVDGAWISAGDLKRTLDKVKGKKVLIFDICYSGNFIGKGKTFEDALVSEFAGSNKGGEFATGGYYVLAAASGREQSWSTQTSAGADFNRPMSVLTRSLTQGLGHNESNGRVMADSSNNGNVTMNEIFDYVTRGGYMSKAQMYPQNSGLSIYSYQLSARSRPLISGAKVSPVGGSAPYKLRFKLNAAAKIRVRVVSMTHDPYNLYNAFQYNNVAWVGGSGEYTSLQPGNHTFSWNGRPSSGLRHVKGDYYFLVEEQNTTAWQYYPFIYNAVKPTISVTAAATLTRAPGNEADIRVYYTDKCAITVNIYDANGKKLRVLAKDDPAIPYGRMETTGEEYFNTYFWDGKDDAGNRLPAGTYQVRVVGRYNGGDSNTGKDTIRVIDN